MFSSSGKARFFQDGFRYAGRRQLANPFRNRPIGNVDSHVYLTENTPERLTNGYKGLGEASRHKKQTMDATAKCGAAPSLRIVKPVVAASNGKPNRKNRAAKT
jgi:hypothetical protein